MKKIIPALLLSSLLLTSCIEKENKADTVYQPSWVTADYRRVENEIFRIAAEKNPYPDQKIDSIEIQQEKRRISNQINIIRKEACSPAESENSAGQTSRSARAIGSDGQPFRIDPECYSKVNTNPLIVNLNNQLEELDKQNRQFSEHTQKVRMFSVDQTKVLIHDYSSRKFEVVVRQGSDTILYNKGGVSVDITDALMQEIDPKKLVMNQGEVKNTTKPEGV